jgi:hypothetical protein
LFQLRTSETELDVLGAGRIGRDEW